MRCADTTSASYGTSNSSRTSAAACITGQSESEPITTPTSGESLCTSESLTVPGDRHVGDALLEVARAVGGEQGEPDHQVPAHLRVRQRDPDHAARALHGRGDAEGLRRRAVADLDLQAGAAVLS